MFDLGGVVVAWEPDLLIAGCFADADERVRVRREVLDHPDWLALDRGTLPRPQAITRAAARSGIDAVRLAEFFIDMPAALTPMPASIDLLRRLHADAQPLYCLSNMHVASIEHLEASHDFFEVFTGRTISCRVHFIKPEPAIYRRLLSDHGLHAADTVFIDDVQVNLDAAAAFGMRTIRFVDATQCAAVYAARVGRAPVVPSTRTPPSRRLHAHARRTLARHGRARARTRRSGPAPCRNHG